MSGTPQTIDAKSLQQIANSYDAANYPAPIVIGHPKTDAPAYGWVDKLYVEGDKLKATVKDVVAQFSDVVKEGRYKKVSVSLFLPNASSNPKPGDFYLKHVGFLGAAAPAVPGLKPVQFSGAGADSVEFSQDRQESADFSSNERAELEALRKERNDGKLEKLINEGRILPVFKAEILEFVGSLDASETFSFSEGQETTCRDWFLSYLERQPKVVSFGAFDMGETGPTTRMPNIAVPDGYTVDTTQNELYARARQIEREKGVSFAEALDLAEDR